MPPTRLGRARKRSSERLLRGAFQTIGEGAGAGGALAVDAYAADARARLAIAAGARAAYASEAGVAAPCAALGGGDRGARLSS